ncbi:helix-turn-helix domain-containing protein [Streptomyces sp. NPDC012623]|uniref:helix-turn-helix domain-containing protein n=1 Tax=unclassified Streptomyces TaxID=2593676 RepID=UPI0036C47707
MSAELLDIEYRTAGLEDRAKAAIAVAGGVERYVDAFVRDAREQDQSWASIARALRISSEVACRKWKDTAGADAPPPGLGSAGAENEGRTRVGKGTAPAHSNKQQLGSALGFLLRASGRTVGAAAEQTGVPAASISRLLAGERVPEWPTIFTLVTILDGRPDELRPLWEWAKGRAPIAFHGGVTAVSRFQSALRGLHLAAGRPALDEVSLSGSLGTDKIRILESALAGDSLAGWEDISLLVRHLGGRPEQFRPLWEDVQYSIFTLSVKGGPHGQE